MDPDLYRVRPGTTVDLQAWPTRDADGFADGKDAGLEALAAANARLTDLQQLLHADGRHKVLVVLQGMDTSGKDGTIKHVFANVNPLGVKVSNFKRPTDIELAHDFLWRIHQRTPGNGELMIFNRSHYEDVLVVRVHDLVPEARWRQRFDQIRNFEQLLVDEGTVVVKFFLHISHEEQRKRLQERVDNPAKHWKFEHGDITERAHWPQYQQAYADAIGRTSTDDAPWYIVPGDRKWYRNLVISNVLVHTLEQLDLRYPPAPEGLEGLVIE